MVAQTMGGAWDQHLEELNRRRVFAPIAVGLVRIEGHKPQGWKHTEHVHPYGQMEVVEGGGFSLRVGEEVMHVKAGDIVLIPPQRMHHFDHFRAGGGWTFKFSAEELTGRYAASAMTAGGLRSCLHRALIEAAATACKHPVDETRMVIEHLIAAVLAIHLGQARPSLAEDEMISVARKLVEARVAARTKRCR